jgi:hypothetical protein
MLAQPLQYLYDLQSWKNDSKGQQMKSGLLTTVVSIGLLFQGCSQEGSTDKRSKSQSNDARLAAKGTSKGNGKDNTTTDTYEDAKDIPTKGDDDDTVEVDVIIPGKGATDSDDDVKGGKDQNPAQNPTQKPTDIPPVELPKKSCVYFDPAMPEYVLKKDQFGANLPPIDISSDLIKGDVQADAETFIGEFTVFQESQNSATWMAKWDGNSGRIPHDYTMVIVNSNEDSCKAYVRFVKQEPRTNNGCFAQHTRIRMFDGTDQVIAMINVGDMVLNPVTKTAQKVVEVRKGKETKAMYEIAFAGSKVMVTETHPMAVKGGIKMAKDVTEADYMFDEKGVIHRVTIAKKLVVNPDQVVVNIRLESKSGDPMQHMVLADGVVSGDLFLQRKMENPAQTAAK